MTGDDLRMMRARAAEVFERHGLVLWQLLIEPTADGSLEFHAFAVLADEDGPVDDGFDEVIRSAHQAEVAARSEESIQELARRLRKGGGFL